MHRVLVAIAAAIAVVASTGATPTMALASQGAPPQLAVTVAEIKATDALAAPGESSYYKPNDGYIFVVLVLSVENLGDTDAAYNLKDISLNDNHGNKYDNLGIVTNFMRDSPEVSAGSTFADPLKIPAHQVKKDFIFTAAFFAVPKSETAFQLNFPGASPISVSVYSAR